MVVVHFNPFLTDFPILYQRFSGVSRGHKMGTVARNGLTKKSTVKPFNIKELKDCKNLIAASAHFLTAIGKFFQGTRLSPLKFEVFLIFSYLLRF